MNTDLLCHKEAGRLFFAHHIFRAFIKKSLRRTEVKNNLLRFSKMTIDNPDEVKSANRPVVRTRKRDSYGNEEKGGGKDIVG